MYIYWPNSDNDLFKISKKKQQKIILNKKLHKTHRI